MITQRRTVLTATYLQFPRSGFYVRTWNLYLSYPLGIGEIVGTQDCDDADEWGWSSIHTRKEMVA